MPLRIARFAARFAAPLALAVATVVATAGIAVASVSFDPATGTGYVDKADVQAAFGWKEGTFQANVRRVGFHAATYTSWTWDCVIGGESVSVTADLESSWVVASEVVSTPGQRRSASGFNLTGLGAQLSSTSDANPASCPDGDPTNVSSSTTDVLYVDLRSHSEVLWTS
jgi:hypothetical protein